MKKLCGIKRKQIYIKKFHLSLSFSQREKMRMDVIINEHIINSLNGKISFSMSCHYKQYESPKFYKLQMMNRRKTTNTTTELVNVNAIIDLIGKQNTYIRKHLHIVLKLGMRFLAPCMIFLFCYFLEAKT